MLKTVLLDLDNTLLSVDMRAFVPAYLDHFARVLADFGPPDEIGALIQQAIGAIRTSEAATLTNQQRHDRVLLSGLKISAGQLQAASDRFFERHYPTLRQHTAPVPDAISLVEHLFEHDYQVVIATNPFYPRPAIAQRLAWAGLADFPYALVTSMQNMHFCKPAPAYYEEILEKVAAQPAQTLMVGDDPVNDIAPSQALSCKTWWIMGGADPPEGADPPSDPIAPDFYGTLSDCYQWFKLDELAL